MVSRAQKKFHDEGVSFQISMDEVLEAIGAGLALTESMRDPNYLDAVIDEAFELADHSFNLQAAALGATGAISHMYEWGTVGINKGRSNVRLNPMSPTARLWTNFAQGTGLDRTIWFAYRPSVANVPKPTAGDTGMSPEVIAQMRDHVFRWKAEVMEEGQDVTIEPKRAKFLLIPAYKERRPYMRPNDVKRGYMLTKGPITTSPGASKYYGNFTSFWSAFWMGSGSEILGESVNGMILSDFQPEFIKRRASASTIRPVGTYKVREQIAANTKKVKTKVISKARARRMDK